MALSPGSSGTRLSKDISVTIRVFATTVKNSKLLFTPWLEIMPIVKKHD